MGPLTDTRWEYVEKKRAWWRWLPSRCRLLSGVPRIGHCCWSRANVFRAGSGSPSYYSVSCGCNLVTCRQCGSIWLPTELTCLHCSTVVSSSTILSPFAITLQKRFFTCGRNTVQSLDAFKTLQPTGMTFSTSAPLHCQIAALYFRQRINTGFKRTTETLVTNILKL